MKQNLAMAGLMLALVTNPVRAAELTALVPARTVPTATARAQVINPELLGLWSNPAGNVVLVAGADGTLRRSGDGGRHWQVAGIQGAPRILSLQGGAGGVLLALAEDRLLRSADEGLNWSAVELPAGAFVSAAVFHKASASWLASSNEGILRSGDGGISWSLVHSVSRETPLLAMIESSTGVLFAGGAQGILLRSADAGLTWTTLATGLRATIARFAVLPGRRGVLSLWSDGSALGVRPDGGGMWKSKTAESAAFSAVAVDTMRSRVFVATSQGRVWISRDQGNSWSTVLVAERMHISALHVDPGNGEITAVGSRATIARSVDAGEHWQILSGGLTAGRLNALQVSADGQQMLAVGSGGLMLRSDDRGRSWSESSADLSRYVSDIAGVPGSNAVLAIGVDGQLLRSTDAGLNWTQHKPMMPADVNFQSLIQDPRSGNFLVCGPMATILRSGDGGQSWRVTQPVPNAHDGVFRQLIADPDSNTLLVLGSPGRVMRSVNGGRDWLVSDAASEADGRGIEQLSALGRGIFMATRSDGLLQRSTDQGQSWQPVEALISGRIHAEPAMGLAWLMSAGSLRRSRDAGLSWLPVQAPAATLNFMLRTRAGSLLGFGNAGAILRSVDEGASWQAQPSGVSVALRKPLLDPLSGDIYVPGREGVVLRSRDDGRSWEPLPTHTRAHLSRLWLDSSGKVLVATGERMVRIELP